MKLFFKHLVRSIGKKPTQPLIIVLTLAFSVAMIIFSFTVKDSLEMDIKMSQEAKYGSADFTVELGNSSDSRFLFASDVRDVLGDRAKVAGTYQLPLIFGDTGDTVTGVATELDHIDDLFSVEFIAYGRVTRATLTEIAFVSADFAEQRGLALGDTIQVETMGQQKAYRIEGIGDRSFLGRYDIMIDIGSVLRVFADQSMLFAAIGEEFKPCNTVYVDLIDDSLRVDEVISSLKSDAHFTEKSFTDVRDIEDTQSFLEYWEVVIGVVVSLAMVLAGVVCFCCFFILSAQREQENFTFVCCGASPLFLGAMQYAEVIGYFLIGAPLGVLIAVPTVQTISLFVGLSYAEVSVMPLTAVKSVLLLFAVCILTVAMFLVFSKRASRSGEKRRRAGLRRVFFLMGIVVILLGLIFVIPTRFSFTVYCVHLASVILFLFAATPPFLQRLESLFKRPLSHLRNETAITFRYALKNISSLKTLQNISMLCALAMMTALTVGFLLTSFRMKVFSYSQLLHADYVVLNATDRCYEKIDDCEETGAVNKFYMNVTDKALLISMQDASACSPIMALTSLPSGNQAVFSVGMARKFDVEIGDSLDWELNGTQYRLEVADIVQSCIGYIAIDCEALGIPYNSILVKGEEGVARADLLNALSEATATELAPIQAADTLFDKISDSMETYMRAGKILFGVLTIFFLIGITDSLYECMRERREDYRLYRLAGITSKQLRRMRTLEITIPILFGLFLGTAVFIILAISLNRGMSVFGVNPYLDIVQGFSLLSSS